VPLIRQARGRIGSKLLLFVTHDVEEAVFLADRVVVLSKGRVLAEFPIVLERRRQWEALIEHADFKAQVAKVLGLVRSA
jgi:NitT/TauT family transport system ATP-binding protein